MGRLRELTFPDPSDAYGLRTATGEGLVDPATGQMLAWHDKVAARQVHEFVYMLQRPGPLAARADTGLGASALGVPVLVGAGAAVWWSQRRDCFSIARHSVAVGADTVILVGGATA